MLKKSYKIFGADDKDYIEEVEGMIENEMSHDFDLKEFSEIIGVSSTTSWRLKHGEINKRSRNLIKAFLLIMKSKGIALRQVDKDSDVHLKSLKQAFLKATGIDEITNAMSLGVNLLSMEKITKEQLDEAMDFAARENTMAFITAGKKNHLKEIK